MKPVLIKTFFYIPAMLLLMGSGSMHQDRWITIADDGELKGLPRKFKPASFNLSEKKLRIKNKEVVFPQCLAQYFDEFKNPELTLTASWYHSKETLPYYINFDISDDTENHSYHILIALETLDLIHVKKSRVEGKTTYLKKIELDSECSNAYKEAIIQL